MDTLNQVKIRVNQLRAELTGMEARRQMLTALIQELENVMILLENEQPAPAPAPKPRQPRGAVEALVLKALDGGFYVTIEDLVAATQQKPNSIRAALKALVKDGKVTEPAPGKFTTATFSQAGERVKGGTKATATEPPNGNEPPARFSSEELPRSMPVGLDAG